ncbi:MAG: FHA domain-containing protein [Saccharofermentans sp.]|nr:FHA domain-containing protein [Saccharofermentans sp.]
MEIRKGPYGQFVINKLENIDSVNNYTREIIAENIPGHMLPLYIIPAVSTYELSYDCSDYFFLIPYIHKTQPAIDRIRKALGDLLLSFVDLPDLLLAPSSLCLDPRFMFISEDLTDIRVCFNPCNTDPNDLCIGSIIKAGLRDLLCSGIFSNVISNDEIDGIVYAAEQNDPELFGKVAKKISTPLPVQDKRSDLLCLNEFRFIILASLMSLIFSLIKVPAAALLFVLLQIFFAVKIRKIYSDKPEITVSASPDDTKMHMLFGKDEIRTGGFDAFILTSTDPDTGIEDKKAVYTDKAAIGSDRFLCDLFYPDKSISPIHAQIKKADKVYYISDLSSDNSTYLNNIRLIPGREYEIKSDQTLICGNKEFRIEII